MIDKNKSTAVYVKFSKSAYEYMRKYSDFIGSSIADFVRQAVAEKIIALGDYKEFENEKK